MVSRKARYKSTPKGRAASGNYRHSAKGRAARARYKKSEKGKAAAKRYRQSEAGRSSAVTSLVSVIAISTSSEGSGQSPRPVQRQIKTGHLGIQNRPLALKPGQHLKMRSGGRLAIAAKLLKSP
jgi:hypothetical protein